MNQLLRTDLAISSFGEDMDGELYVLDHINGAIFQLQSPWLNIGQKLYDRWLPVADLKDQKY